MKVLISAYACEPGEGSEPGVGWNWARAAAERHEVWVLTRSNNREPIEAGLGRDPLASLHFRYLDLPPWARAWKRGRLGLRLYYLVWQLLVAREARRLRRELGIDVVHHLTFANLWLPALASLAGGPFVLGPVGGGQRVPRQLYPTLGRRAAVQERLLLAARQLARLNPLVRTGWKRATIILANNEETRLAVPGRYRHRTVLRPNYCVRPELAAMRREPDPLLAVYAGRLNRFKGVELAVRALTLAPLWTLVVIGDGPDAKRLEALAERLGLADRVRFEGWLPQEALWQRLAGAGALVFPSLKEGAPSIVAEAQALGVPVVAFDLAGVSVLAREPGACIELVTPCPPAEAVSSFAAALRRVEHGPVERPDPALGPEGVTLDLDLIYRIACARTPGDDVATEWMNARAGRPRSASSPPSSSTVHVRV